MKLYIKNMVCQRCVMAVESILSSLAIPEYQVTLVEVTTSALPPETIALLADKLDAIGFELLDDKKKQLIEKIKGLIITYIHHDPELQKYNMSEFLSHEIPFEYNYISNVFSEIEGTTIEKYVIAQKN